MAKLRFKTSLAIAENSTFEDSFDLASGHNYAPVAGLGTVANNDVPGQFEFISQSPVFVAYSDLASFTDSIWLYNLAAFAEGIALADGLNPSGPTLIVHREVQQVLGNHFALVLKHTKEAIAAAREGQDSSQVVIEQNSRSVQKWHNYFLVQLYADANFASIRTASLVEIMRYPQYSASENIAVLNFEVNRALSC